MNAQSIYQRRDQQSKPDEDENEDIYLPESTEAAEEDDNYSPAVRALMAKSAHLPYTSLYPLNSYHPKHRMAKDGRRATQEDEEPTCTKIYYASRTHSQLTQILPEMKRLKLAPMQPDTSSNSPCGSSSKSKKRAFDEPENELADAPISYSRTVSLGSRKQLCINDDLRSKSRDLDEGCRELLGGMYRLSRNVLRLAHDFLLQRKGKQEMLAPPAYRRGFSNA